MNFSSPRKKKLTNCTYFYTSLKLKKKIPPKSTLLSAAWIFTQIPPRLEGKSKKTAFNAELAGARGRPSFRRKIKPTPKAGNCWHLMTHPKHCQTVRFRCNTHIERRARERSRAGSGEQSGFVFALGLELELNLYWRNYIYL